MVLYILFFSFFVLSLSNFPDSFFLLCLVFFVDTFCIRWWPFQWLCRGLYFQPFTVIFQRSYLKYGLNAQSNHSLSLFLHVRLVFRQNPDNPKQFALMPVVVFRLNSFLRYQHFKCGWEPENVIKPINSFSASARVKITSAAVCSCTAK